MKNRFSKIFSILFAITLLFSACEDKWIDPDVNIDPDSPLKVPMNQLLSAIEARMGYNLGGFDFVGTTAMWSQHVTGVSRQAATIGKYNITEADMNNLWNTVFAGIVMDIKVLIDQSSPEYEDAINGSPHFSGAAKILLANTLGLASDVWDDVPVPAPYGNGALGLDNLEPQFTDQQTIYSTIQQLLNEAITDLQTDDLVNDFPLDGDYFYEGDTQAWIKVAYTLKARYAMHLTKVGGVNYDEVLNNLANGLTANEEDFELYFADANTQANPLYQYNDQRGDCESNNDFLGMLEANGDPRSAVFGTQPFGPYADMASPVVFISFVESKFLEAEAAKLKGDQATADAAYNAAVSASLAKFGVSDPTWEAEHANKSGVTIADIMTAKYFALFAQAEVFVDLRRYDFQYPALSPATGSQFPRCFPYGNNERIYNSNCPKNDKFDKVWWDK